MIMDLANVVVHGDTKHYNYYLKQISYNKLKSQQSIGVIIIMTTIVKTIKINNKNSRN